MGAPYRLDVMGVAGANLGQMVAFPIKRADSPQAQPDSRRLIGGLQTVQVHAVLTGVGDAIELLLAQ